MKPFWVKVHLYAGLIPALFLVLVAGSGILILLEGRVLPPAFVAEQHTLEVRDQRVELEPVLTEIRRRYDTRPYRLSLREDPSDPDSYRIRTPEGQDFTVLVNPYTGEILEKTSDFRTPLSRTIRNVHLKLLSGVPGRWLVDLSTALLLLVLLSGIVLTIFSLKKSGLRALSVRWNGNFKSWNHRFHNVLGVTLVPVLLVVAFTGCYLAFEPAEQMTISLLASTEQSAVTAPAPTSSNPSGTEPLSVDSVLGRHGVFENRSRWERIWIWFPQDETEVYRVEKTPRDEGRAEKLLYLDQYTGERYVEARKQGESVRSLMRSLHFGTIGGVWTEIIWFLSCLAIPVFVVSGGFIWWTRKG